MFNPVNANQTQGVLGVGQGGRGVTGFSFLEKVIGFRSATLDRQDRKIASPNEGCPSTTGYATYFAGAQHSKQEKQNKLAAECKASINQLAAQSHQSQIRLQPGLFNTRVQWPRSLWRSTRSL